MASTISIRVYLLSVKRRGAREKLSFDTSAGGIAVSAFVANFISNRSAATEDVDLERSWYFEEKVKGNLGNSKGYIHYGTFGFESNLVDTTTKKSNYKRKTTDSEIIPLFYEFWRPPKAHHMFIVFQSFQGKSCVNMVTSNMQELFGKTHPGHLLLFKKLIPSDSSGSIYKDYPVQKLTLIKRNVSGDIADRYAGARPSEPVNLEVSLIARRKGSVGNFGLVTTWLKPAGIMTHEGVTFDEATANVRVGGRTRPVGIFGGNSEAGVIDLTDSVKRGLNGHPTFESIVQETNSILKDFDGVIGSRREN